MGACIVVHVTCPRCNQVCATSSKLDVGGEVSFAEAAADVAQDVSGMLKCFGCNNLLYLDPDDRSVKVATLSDS